mmetsp:Transcript_17460/g.52385  ORF Transcript_17460/g.52385 Transcript_17460/m.52385 type:complete len:247 (-) Transcript_17460:90-830(-)|eukprot:CAMPEP_0206144804 /NCGR_PEP_ID=MMETSP1473-20131121/25421_1 /ASSEMBLY_ACC=CAM_ASM_001109 /TAXON_ID=1461547 /ORGANISM="Stichococcus sp, Strain RCC1054" /LENGTH=246 /DNA_ID=CAMNT_0053540773 /DNA_START=217 /DNA_END=957 /DNA_ORIENTATION=-
MGDALVKLELEAYTAVLRAFAAQPMNWTREKLLSEMRRELHISTESHIIVMEAVMKDEELSAIREGKPIPAPSRRGAHASHGGDTTPAAETGRRGIARTNSRRPSGAADTPASAPRRSESTKRAAPQDFDADETIPERSLAPTGAGSGPARNRSKRRQVSAAPDVAVKFPLTDAALKEALASVTAADLEPLRDGLDKHAAEVLSQIVAASAPVSAYPDEKKRLEARLKALTDREQSLRVRLQAIPV